MTTESLEERVAQFVDTILNYSLSKSERAAIIQHVAAALAEARLHAGLNAELSAVETFGVLLAEAEMECGCKHKKAFEKLNQWRSKTLAELERVAVKGDANANAGR